MSYFIGRSACGCIEAVTGDDLGYAELGSLMIDWMRRNLQVERVNEPPQLWLCPPHQALKDVQVIRATSIKIIEVSSDDSWLAGFLEGREKYCDTFWRSDFPNGISQTVASLPFNEVAKMERLAQWNRLVALINGALDEGFVAVRLRKSDDR